MDAAGAAGATVHASHRNNDNNSFDDVIQWMTNCQLLVQARAMQSTGTCSATGARVRVDHSIPGLNPPTTAAVAFALAFFEVAKRFDFTGTVYAPCTTTQVATRRATPNGCHAT